MGVPPTNNPRGQQAFGVSTAFTVVAFIAVALRLYTRWFIVRAPGIEDHFIIVATVSVGISNFRAHPLIHTQFFSIGLTICIGYRKCFPSVCLSSGD